MCPVFCGIRLVSRRCLGCKCILAQCLADCFQCRCRPSRPGTGLIQMVVELVRFGASVHNRQRPDGASAKSLRNSPQSRLWPVAPFLSAKRLVRCSLVFVLFWFWLETGVANRGRQVWGRQPCATRRHSRWSSLFFGSVAPDDLRARCEPHFWQ